MFGKGIRKSILALGAVGGLAVGLSAGPAAAAVLNAWQFNLGDVSGSFSDITNINYMSLDGTSTITQNVVGGSALGQTFSETGQIFITGYHLESDITPYGIGGIIGTNQIYFRFTNLTGTLNPDGTVTFDPNSGTIALYLDSNGNFGDGTTATLGNFDIVAPSGGSNLDFFGGAQANSTLDVTLVETSTLYPGLYADSLGNPLPLNLTLHLGNLDSKLCNIDPNPDNSGVVNGDGTSLICVENAGQYNLALKAPEPGSLALVGFGLLGLAFLRRRTAKA